MKKDLLRAYAAVVTGLLADVASAALLGGYTDYGVVAIAFVSTLIFCLAGAGFMAFTEPRTSVKIRDGKTEDKPGKRKNNSRKAFERYLPGLVRVAIMRHAWRVKQREKRRRPPEPQIYTLRGDVIKIPVNGAPDLMEYVPVWTARKEG